MQGYGPVHRIDHISHISIHSYEDLHSVSSFLHRKGSLLRIPVRFFCVWNTEYQFLPEIQYQSCSFLSSSRLQRTGKARYMPRSFLKINDLCYDSFFCAVFSSAIAAFLSFSDPFFEYHSSILSELSLRFSSSTDIRLPFAFLLSGYSVSMM